MKKLCVAISMCFLINSNIYTSASRNSGSGPSMSAADIFKKVLQEVSKSHSIINQLKISDKIITTSMLKDLEQQTNINYDETVPNTGETVLMIAIDKGRMDIVMYLVDKKKIKTLNSKDKEGNTALHRSIQLVASYQHFKPTTPEYQKYLDAIAIAKYIATQFAMAQLDTTQKNKYGQTALDGILSLVDKKVVHELAQKLIPDLDAYISYSHDQDMGETALMKAIDNKRFDVAMFLISLKPEEINKQDQQGDTALHHLIKQITKLAAKRPRDGEKYQNAITFAKYLIDKFTQSAEGTSQKNKEDQTALDIAQLITDETLKKELIAKLSASMKHDHLNVIQPVDMQELERIPSRSRSITSHDLSHSITNGNSTASPSKAETNGTKSSPREDADVKAAKQETPLRRSSVITVLQNPKLTPEGFKKLNDKYHFDYTTKDLKNGQTVLMMAAKKNLLEIVTQIVESKTVDLNEQDKEGNTALHHILKTIIKIKFDIAQEQKKNGAGDKKKIDELTMELGHAHNLALYLIKKMVEFDGGKGLILKNKDDETPLVLVSDDDGSDDDNENGISGISSALFGKNYRDEIIQDQLLKIPIIKQQFFASDDSENHHTKKKSENKKGRK